jgi:4-hydroxybenzoate polyprenyltransferase
MLWMFMLLGAAYHDGLAHLGARQLSSALALGAAYVAATSINDIADQAIDRVNHPRDPGRPLVSGEATERDLYQVHLAASLLALVLAVPLGVAGVAVIGLSLLVAHSYSVGPVRFSYRSYLAPLVLAVAYVLVPYWIGLIAAGVGYRRSDLPFSAALMALFLARINLKDFRDREGDARYGKPTLLGRFGKRTTCQVSLAAFLLGLAGLLASTRPPLPAAVLLGCFPAAIAAMLWRAADGHAEQVAIGIGARMGNGLLLTMLGWLVLGGHGASEREQVAWTLVMTAVFGASFVLLVARPQDIVLGYKA